MKLTTFALIECDESYLLICEASPKWKGKWFFPGGHAKKHETPEQAVVRETKEEAACEIALKGMFYSRYFPGLMNNKLCIYYYAEAITKDIKKQADKHSLESRWFRYEEILKLPLRDNVIDIINTYRNLKRNHSLQN
jgi:ADP-ribose pyrophosphatase YjhB (NUDIX family)